MFIVLAISVTPEHIAYIHQMHERTNKARRVGGIPLSITERLSFSTASPLNQALIDDKYGKASSSRGFGSSPLTVGILSHRNHSLHSNTGIPRRRVSSMSAVGDEYPSYEPQFSTNVLVFDMSAFQGLHKGLGMKYK